MTYFSWCNNNPAGRVAPPDDLIKNGFKPTTVGNNFWLNYIFWYISVHIQNPPGTYVKYFLPTYPGALICHGETFGSSSSGAVYANDEYKDLFVILWDAGGYEIIGGRGASAEADWNANKQMNLPDRSGAGFAGYSATPGSIFNALVGTRVGSETVTLNSLQLPIIQPTINDPGHTHTTALNYRGVQDGTYFDSVDFRDFEGHFDGTEFPVSSSATTGISIEPLGAGQAHNNVQPSIITNYFIIY